MATNSMLKTISYKTRGHRADIGPIGIYRLVSNNYVDHVGPFVFLDYIPPFMLPEKMLNPDAAHPHRGIATLTYSLNGEMEHYDSRGHRGTVHSGGAQWMKAGNGIVHNEAPGPDTKTGGKLMHGFQFWINLPAKNKQDAPEYLALQADDLSVLPLAGDTGTLKLVAGEYGGRTSKIPAYTRQLLYHIRLKPGKQFALTVECGLEIAVFLPQQTLAINGHSFHAGDLIGFDEKGEVIEFANNLESEAEFVVFGGEKYTEPYVARGPFVMSSQDEIREAHEDYMNGKYGSIVYDT